MPSCWSDRSPLLVTLYNLSRVHRVLVLYWYTIACTLYHTSTLFMYLYLVHVQVDQQAGDRQVSLVGHPIQGTIYRVQGAGNGYMVMVLGTGYWYRVLEQGTGTGYWYRLLVQGTGSGYWYSVTNRQKNILPGMWPPGWLTGWPTGWPTGRKNWQVGDRHGDSQAEKKKFCQALCLHAGRWLLVCLQWRHFHHTLIINFGFLAFI